MEEAKKRAEERVRAARAVVDRSDLANTRGINERTTSRYAWVIGMMLAILELGRYAAAGVSHLVLRGAVHIGGGVNLTTWFAVLVIIVLAEVFREGARLRGEAELTI